MEGDEHQRRQYEQQGYGPTRDFVQQPRGVQEANVSDGFRQPHLLVTRSPTSAGAGAHDLGNYDYTQGQQYAAQQMQGGSLQYQPDYSQDAQRQQQFPQYGSNVIYNVPQQSPHQSSYDPMPQYPPRQSAAIEVLSTQFGVPQYYHSGEPTSAPGPAAMPQQYAPTQFQPPMSYQQPTPLGRSTLPSSYPPGMATFAQPSAPDVLEHHDVAEESTNFDRAYAQYQNALKQTFERTRSGRLIEAGQSLLEISDWLLGNASDLGLVRDDQDLHGERIKLWNDFNTCWLAVLQRQKDNTQEMLDTGQPPRPQQSILQTDFLERMGRELVRLCDSMEKHGLVDYQMGVWEEEIMSILTECLDLLEGEAEDGPDVEAPAPSRSPVRAAGTR